MKIISFFLVLLASLTFAQDGSRVNEPTNQAFLPQGIRWQGLSANGFSYNFPTSLSQISGSNPAALTNFDTLMFGISYQYDTDIKEAYIADIGYKHNYPGISQSIAFVYPYDEKITIGLSVAQKYNSLVDFGEIPVTTSKILKAQERFSALNTKQIFIHFRQ